MSQTAAQGPETLYALMYASDAAVEADPPLLEQILQHARAKNALLSITGILLFRQGSFFQYLEGPEESVRRVYEQISKDPRHSNLRVLIEGFGAERKFSDWTMGYEPLRDTPAILPSGFRSTFSDLEDTRKPSNVLRAVTELTFWYRARAARPNRPTRADRV